MSYVNTLKHDSGEPAFQPARLELRSGVAAAKIEQRLKHVYPGTAFNVSIIRGTLDVIMIVYSGTPRRQRVIEEARYFGFADRDPFTRKVFAHDGPMILTKDGPLILTNTSRIIVERVA